MNQNSKHLKIVKLISGSFTMSCVLSLVFSLQNINASWLRAAATGVGKKKILRAKQKREELNNYVVIITFEIFFLSWQVMNWTLIRKNLQWYQKNYTVI